MRERSTNVARAKSAIKKKDTKKKSAIAGAGKTAAFRQNGVSTKRTVNSVLNYVPWSTVELEELNHCSSASLSSVMKSCSLVFC